MAGGGPDAPRQDALKHTRRDTGAHLLGWAGIARREAGWGAGAEGLGPGSLEEGGE